MANRHDTPSPWLKSVAYALIISFSALVAFMLVTVDSAISLVQSDPIGYLSTTAVLVGGGIAWSMIWSWLRRNMSKRAVYDWGPIAYAALGLFVLFGVERAAATHDFLACTLAPEPITVHDMRYRTNYFPARRGVYPVTEADGFYLYNGRRVSVTLAAEAAATTEGDFTVPRYGAHLTCGTSPLRKVVEIGIGVLTFSRAVGILRRRQGWLSDADGPGEHSGVYTG